MQAGPVCITQTAHPGNSYSAPVSVLGNGTMRLSAEQIGPPAGPPYPAGGHPLPASWLSYSGGLAGDRERPGGREAGPVRCPPCRHQLRGRRQWQRHAGRARRGGGDVAGSLGRRLPAAARVLHRAAADLLAVGAGELVQAGLEGEPGGFLHHAAGPSSCGQCEALRDVSCRVARLHGPARPGAQWPAGRPLHTPTASCCAPSPTTTPRAPTGTEKEAASHGHQHADARCQGGRVPEAGDTRRALHRARDLVERQLAALRVSDPPRAALLDAALAGRLAAMAEGLPSWQPRKPPGYTSGPPEAAHLIAAYEAARTSRQR